MVEDKGPLVVGVVIFSLVLSGIFISARLYTRTVIKPYYGLDDTLIVITWFLVLGYNIAVFISLRHGYGKHTNDLAESQYVQALRAQTIAQTLAIISFPSGKASIAYLITRLFFSKKLRWFLWTFVAINAASFYLLGFLRMIQCNPVAFQWDRSIEGGTCWDTKIIVDFGYLVGVIGTVTDFAFATVPWFYIAKVRISLREKIIVGVALSAGYVAGFSSIVKIYYTSTMNPRSDQTFDTVPLVVWSNVELALINVAACIPTLRPLYRWLSGKNPQSPDATGPACEFQPSLASRLSERLKSCGPRNAALESTEDIYELNIYHTRTCEVTYAGQEDEQAKMPAVGSGLGATVEVSHGF